MSCSTYDVFPGSGEHGEMKRKILVLGFFLSTLIAWTPSVHAQDDFQKGRTELGFNVGLGGNFHINNNVREDVDFYFLTPYWGKILKKWAQGSTLEFIAEGFLSYANQDSEARYAVGISPLIVYNFKEIWKIVPFLELGVGVLYTDLNPHGFGSHFDFTPQAGVGLRYELARGTFLNFSYRYHHISNAGISSENDSIDSNFILMGISFLR